MSLWTARQREWLEAMGHPVMVLAGAANEVPPAMDAPPMRDVADDSTSDSRQGARSAPDARVQQAAPGGSRPTAPRQPPVVEPGPAAAVEAVPAGAGRRQLFRALLRATGQRTSRAAEQALATLDIAIDIERLRQDPAAKRALWLRLRALRRSTERR